jgi:hypothetical protein
MADTEHPPAPFPAGTLVSAAHARLREALSARPGWRSLPPQQLPTTGEWRASAYDARGGGSAARVSATGPTEEEAVSTLAALLLRTGA